VAKHEAAGRVWHDEPSKVPQPVSRGGAAKGPVL